MARFNNRPVVQNCCALLLALAVIVTVAPATLMAAKSKCDGPYTESAMHGGEGGAAFTDDVTKVEQIKTVSIRHGAYVDAIQTEVLLISGKLVQNPRHGGGGGTESSFTLEEDEYIVRIEGRSGSYVDQLTFFTSKGRKFGPYGGPGGNPFSIEGCVAGFKGRSGLYLDAVVAFVSALN